jgi:hypothetical protein
LAGFAVASQSGRLDLNRRRKPRTTITPAGTTEAHASRGFVPVARKSVPASPTDHLGQGSQARSDIGHCLRQPITHDQAYTGLDLGASWEQYWQRQPHAATMRKHQGGDVRALDSQTVSTTATCFQYHEWADAPDSKSGPRKGGVGSSPTLGISGLGRTATTI